LWFIQWKSLQPGGLFKFTEEILEEFPERIGTPTMRRAAGRKLSIEEKVQTWGELPRPGRPYAEQESVDELRADLDYEDLRAESAKKYEQAVERNLKAVESVMRS